MPPYGPRKAEYNAYIQSEHWAAVRRVFWAQTKRECARCGSTVKLHVHHMTYENFKNEQMSDLIGLCQKCHSLVHRAHNQYGGSLQEMTIKIVGTKRVVLAKRKKKPVQAKKIATQKKRRTSGTIGKRISTPATRRKGKDTN